MAAGSGKYLKTVNGALLFARVRVELATSEDVGLRIDCSPSVFSELGGDVDPAAPGYVAWRRGAEEGVRVGAEIAGISAGAVQICSIVGTYVDTTEGAVLGAAALAFWDAAGFLAPPSARARLDEIVVPLRYPFEA